MTRDGYYTLNLYEPTILFMLAVVTFAMSHDTEFVAIPAIQNQALPLFLKIERRSGQTTNNNSLCKPLNPGILGRSILLLNHHRGDQAA